MAAGDLSTVIFNSGKLIKGPFNFAGAEPYGGTYLGLTRDVVIMPSQLKVELTAEEFGQITVEAVDIGRAYVLGCNLRGWDNDAISSIMPGSVNAGAGVYETTSSPRAGSLMSDRAFALLFAPDDATNHKATLLYRCIPLIDESAELRLQLANEFLFPVMFLAIPDSAGQIYSHELIVNL